MLKNFVKLKTEGIMEVLLILKGVVFDTISNSPVLILKDAGAERYLPIWIGLFEAQAIALKLDNIPTPRPMTHDLLNNMLKDLGIHIEKIVISDIRDNTYFAEIHLKMNDKKYVIDSRPSDAIALAVRCDCEIFANEEIMQKAKFFDMDSEGDELEQLKKWLEEMDPETLGKYKM